MPWHRSGDLVRLNASYLKQWGRDVSDGPFRIRIGISLLKNLSKQGFFGHSAGFIGGSIRKREISEPNASFLLFHLLQQSFRLPLQDLADELVVIQ